MKYTMSSTPSSRIIQWKFLQLFIQHTSSQDEKFNDITSMCYTVKHHFLFLFFFLNQPKKVLKMNQINKNK